MIAPDVAQLIDTATDPEYVPGTGLKVGVATAVAGVIVYVPDAVALAVCPVLKAFAFKTLDPVSVNGFP